MNIETDFLSQFPNESHSVIQSVKCSLLQEKNIILDVKREDMVHPFLSGNKWRKLKYNVAEAKKTGKKAVLTFGGAHSNHIYATAAAGRIFDFETIGIIRGDELTPDNDTLSFAQACGMKLKFVSREAYKQKDTSKNPNFYFKNPTLALPKWEGTNGIEVFRDTKKSEPAFLEALHKEFGDFYLLPEGGTNALAIQGCEEVLSTEIYQQYDFIALMIGTGGTFSGILNASEGVGHIIGISSLKGDFIHDEIKYLNTKYGLKGFQNYSIFTQFHHGGYGKSSVELDAFMTQFTNETGIPIEFVYSGKLFYALFNLIKNDFFKPETKILAIHTGGLRV